MFESIKKYNELCKTRSHPSFWHNNLIDAELTCKDDREKKHFYNYIVNPSTYSYDRVESPDYRTLGDSIDQGTIVEPKDLPSNVESTLYKNGNEYMVYNKVVDTVIDVIEEEDEKHPT
jgi:hypothetical protein